jgi:hypothetical protein
MRLPSWMHPTRVTAGRATSRGRRRRARVAFCDRCGRVCDAQCRSAALRDAHLVRDLYLGGGR